MKRLIGVLFFATACTVSQTSETKEDSVAALSSDTLQVVTGDPEPVDTVFNTIEKKGNVQPKLDPKTAYVWSFSGLDVFNGTGEDQKIIGNLAQNTKVKLDSPLPAKGWVSIEFKDGHGFIMSDDLMPLPVPDTTDVLEYFRKNLALAGDVVEKSNPGEPDSEDAFRFVDYYFEGGYRVSSKTYYESGYSSVKLPGMSMEKAFVFISYFEESFQNAFEEYPKEARKEELPNEQYLTVEMENNKVSKIIVGNGFGCYEETSIAVIEGGVEMKSEGGC